jgi:hypothetical protein
MAPEEAVPVESMPPDPGSTKQEAKQRSTIEFPYLDLDDAAGIAKGVHEAGGVSCLIEQLAGLLHVVATGGGFRLRLLTARLFGLVTYDRNSVTITELGSKICDQRQEPTARASAFLEIPLYAKLYEEFKGKVLPGNPGIENAMVRLGVAPKQGSKARQAFQRSAQQAGFFAHGNDRLVMPAVRGEATAGTPIAEESAKEAEESTRKRGSSGASGDDGGYHPFIQGLLKALPIPDSPWPIEARRKWLQAASFNFDLIYTDPSNGTLSLRIEIEKVTAG